ncbi:MULTISPECIES: hypothetical protein [Stenotrophomonas]|uniref:hypothetical protein n=1 Tax=Stenotrophomonas TaxID=40323 RepID=UPI00104D1AE1|nr:MULTISPECIES: hypothetical protein [Stenotrophomonas]ELN2584543.1 hypothetical protein [Stenotrophomonas maltophilia]ELN2592267.1 hypothetical protein [Stenotrophomonas maltophilia]MBH1403316.1 hypothetical protein [Stenotrophomonas maltophilia]MBH1705434.1 hypothetical protein [Stenotrophomonas maltophilia]
MKLLRLCFALLMFLVSGPALAQVAEVKVTGRFRPSALNPGNSEFENTTPRGSFCNWRPEECDKKGAYIFNVGGGEFWRKSGDGDNASRRDTTYVRFPNPRIINLTEVATGRSFPAKISFAAIALRLDFTNGVDPWYYGISGGCTAIRGGGGLGWSNGGWGVRDPSEPKECFSNRPRNSRTYRYRNVGIGIKVELPRATTLLNGRYEASESWSTGGLDADIDLGDNITGTSSIRMNFVFDVIHDFEVMFSSESPTARLVPDGGWSQWIDYGLVPRRLHQELPFNLTSSMDFSMKLRCEYEVDDRCGIQNAANDELVPVDVDVTIPGMSNVRDGRPAQNTALLPDDARAPRFTPDGYLMQRRSTLRFTAGREAVTEMLKSPGSHWQGNMTVVFDANP